MLADIAERVVQTASPYPTALRKSKKLGGLMSLLASIQENKTNIFYVKTHMLTSHFKLTVK